MAVCPAIYSIDTCVRTVIAKNPIDCVAVGIGRIIETTGDASVYVNYRTR